MWSANSKVISISGPAAASNAVTCSGSRARRASARSRAVERARLAGLLVDQVRDAQIFSRPIPDRHIRTLLSAAFLLKEYRVPLPSPLQQIVHGAERGAD